MEKESKQDVVDRDVPTPSKKKDWRIGKRIRQFFRHISVEPAYLLFLVGVTVQVSIILFFLF